MFLQGSQLFFSTMNDNRPLSPHLQVYRLPLNAWLSISHRFTGVLLSLAFVLLVVWLAVIAFMPHFYTTLQQFFSSWLGQAGLLALVAMFYFHLCNGIRHLIWDLQIGFENDTVELTSYLVLLATAILTFITWLFFD